MKTGAARKTVAVAISLLMTKPAASQVCVAMEMHVCIASNATWRRSRVLVMLRYARRLCRQQACGRTQSLTTFEF